MSNLTTNDIKKLSGTSVQFCSKCDNLMKYTIDGKWICTVCNFTVDAQNFVVTFPETRPDSSDYSLYSYDNTLKRIYRFCPVCKSNQEMVVFYGKEKTMTNNYVCTYCKNLLAIE